MLVPATSTAVKRRPRRLAATSAPDNSSVAPRSIEAPRRGTGRSRYTFSWPPGGRLALLGLPEHLVDLSDRVEQLLTLGRVGRLLRRARLLGRRPEQVVQLRVLLEVSGGEVVGPEHPQVVLHEVGALFLDDQAARLVVLHGLSRGLELGRLVV